MAFVTDKFLHIISCVWWATHLQPHAQRIYEGPGVSTFVLQTTKCKLANIVNGQKILETYYLTAKAGVHKCVFAPSLLNRSNLQRRCQLTQNEEFFCPLLTADPSWRKATPAGHLQTAGSRSWRNRWSRVLEFCLEQRLAPDGLWLQSQ